MDLDYRTVCSLTLVERIQSLVYARKGKIYEEIDDEISQYWHTIMADIGFVFMGGNYSAVWTKGAAENPQDIYEVIEDAWHNKKTVEQFMRALKKIKNKDDIDDVAKSLHDLALIDLIECHKVCPND